MRIASLAVALPILALAHAASATPIAYGDSYVYVQPPPPPPPPADPNPEHHLQPVGEVGMLIGGFRVGPISGMAAGLKLGAGVRLDRIALDGEYDFISVGESDYTNPDPVRGLVHRIGANIRYSFATLSKHGFPLRGDFWLEAGVGRQYLRWYGGGKLTRNDVSLGLAGQLSFRFGETKHKKIGLFYALKVMASKRPDEKMLPPTCAGPCDEPTGPIPYDLGVFFDFAVVFGR